PFLIARGDRLADVDLEALSRRHAQAASVLTLGLKRLPEAGEHPVIDLDERERVLRVREPPEPGAAAGLRVDAGIALAEPELMQWLPPEKPWDWDRTLF